MQEGLESIALQLALGHLKTPPSADIQVALGRTAGRGGRILMSAWVDKKNPKPTIYVNKASEYLKQSEKGNTEAQKALAAALMHEQWHLDVPTSGEGPAYERELEVLRELKAKPEALLRVFQRQQLQDPGYAVLPSRKF